MIQTIIALIPIFVLVFGLTLCAGALVYPFRKSMIQANAAGVLAACSAILRLKTSILYAKAGYIELLCFIVAILGLIALNVAIAIKTNKEEASTEQEVSTKEEASTKEEVSTEQEVSDKE